MFWRSTPQKELSPAIQAVPTGLTALTTTDSIFYNIVVSNPSGGAITLLVTDGLGGVLVPTVSIAAAGQYTLESVVGIFCDNGIKWQASGSGLQASIFAKYV